MINDASSSFVQPFEGQKYLWSSGLIAIQSPTQQPIQSFTLRLFSLPPPKGYDLQLFVGGVAVTDQFNAWQTVQKTFDSPVQSLAISAIISHLGGDRAPLGYAIDAIEFTTIPEPQTLWLLAVGLTAIASRPLLKRPKPNRA